MSTPAYDECVAQLEKFGRSFNVGVITAAELVTGLSNVLAIYFEDDEDPRDDCGLLIEYALDVARPASLDHANGDRLAIDRLDRLIRFGLEMPGPRVELDLMLERFRIALAFDVPGTRSEIIEMCAQGAEMHPLLFARAGFGIEMLRFAREHCIAEALSAAVTPARDSWGQLGNRRRENGRAYQLAFDWLAELACAPEGEPGERARSELIHLAEFFETAADAAVRLPAHLLTRHDRVQLVDTLRHYETHLARDPLFVENPDRYDRIPVTLRSVCQWSVLWHALDSAYVRERE